MVKRLDRMLLVMLVTVGTGIPLWAQTDRRDQVILENDQRVSGKVVKESWKTVELDNDMNGTVDTTYEADQVREVIYGNVPKYLAEAQQLRGKPEERQAYIDGLKKVYFDRSTSKYQLQHAYYEIAKQYEELSATDEESLGKAMEAYQKLVDDIPDTRYALQLRVNLSEVFLARGEMEQSRKNLDGLITGDFGEGVAAEARLRKAQTFLLEGDVARTETELDQIKVDGLNRTDQLKLDVLRADVLVARGQGDKAYDELLSTLKEERLGGVEAQAYVVLGDVFRLRGHNEEALLAYLRVHLMCDNVDTVTHARALVGAIKVFRKLNRREQSRQLREELTGKFPGALWERKLRE